MKRIIALILSLSILFTGCTVGNTNNVPESVNSATSDIDGNDTYQHIDIPVEELEFSGLDDNELRQYIKDSVYINLEAEYDAENIIIESVETRYISKEYIDEIEFNSEQNIFFGYNIQELDKIFDGTKYVFTVDENNETTVVPMEILENNVEETVIKNVATGSGVIIICVTVSFVGGAAGLTTVSTIFTASAKAAKAIALSSALFSGLQAGLIEAYRTGDFEQALENAAVNASEGFKWGAIAGSVTGAAAEAYKVKVAADAAKKVPTPRESELAVLDKYAGREQVSYMNGQEVPFGTNGSTRPDVIVDKGNGLIEAIEVKNYELKGNTHQLYKTLRAQIEHRALHLPEGATQKVVLDVRGRGYTDELLNYVVRKIQENCYDIYPNLPVEIIR